VGILVDWETGPEITNDGACASDGGYPLESAWDTGNPSVKLSLRQCHHSSDGIVDLSYMQQEMEIAAHCACIRGMPNVGKVKHSHAETEKLLKEVYGPSAVLRDAGLKGQVDPADVFIYKNGKGKLVKTTLGKTRAQQASMQLNIVKAAKAFHAAGVNFSGSSKTDKVNKDLWWMGYGGKMGVRQGVKPSDALNDIFKNGDKYGMECATGTMVIFYKGILDTIGPKDFDRAFEKTRLFRWDIKDDDFKKAEKVGKLPGYWPGDHTYFKNPDFDPAHSAFQGENVIYLGEGMYFGHGLGVVSEQGVIDSLNGLRKPGAKKGAYRDDFELRLDGGKIAGLDLDPD
jgi:hypothetical protein